MDTEDVQAAIEELVGNIDSLESSLEPILKNNLSVNAVKLPLLDKAKLYVLATYAIESVLFSALRLNGVDAKSHPVFAELNRVKEYFEKIKKAETGGLKRPTTLDKDAAGRFIRHGLAGNDKYDRERSERQAQENAVAKRKLEDISGLGTHTRFEGTAARITAAEREGQQGKEQDQVHKSKSDKKAAKRQRRLESRDAKQSPADSPHGAAMKDTDEEDDNDAATPRSKSKSKSAPKSQSEALQALLERKATSTPEGKEKKKKRKKDREQDVAG